MFHLFIYVIVFESFSVDLCCNCKPQLCPGDIDGFSFNRSIHVKITCMVCMIFRIFKSVRCFIVDISCKPRQIESTWMILFFCVCVNPNQTEKRYEDDAIGRRSEAFVSDPQNCYANAERQRLSGWRIRDQYWIKRIRQEIR